MFANFRDYAATVTALVLSGLLFLSIAMLHSGQEPLSSVVFASPQQLLSTSDSSSTIELNASELAPRMAYGYTPGTGDVPFSNTVSKKNLARLGYNPEQLWQVGIRLVPHDGAVPKNCPGLSGNSEVSGLAVKPNVVYPSCDNGSLVISNDYKTPDKCTVHYNGSQFAQTAKRGSTSSVIAHEIGHCLHFIYGETQGITFSYVAIRPSVAGLSDHSINEIFADDYMICKHGLNTDWGINSYYSQFSISNPTDEQCGRLNALYEVYFPI